MPEDRILRLPEVKQMVGLCTTSIYEIPGFPKPIKLTARSSGWRLSAIEKWLAERERLSPKITTPNPCPNRGRRMRPRQPIRHR